MGNPSVVCMCQPYINLLHISSGILEGVVPAPPNHTELGVWVGEVLTSFPVGGLPRLLEPFREQKAALLVSGQKRGTCRMSPRKLPTTR